MPTSTAAKAPKACESAIRCGMAVMGMNMAMAAADQRADDEAGDDPLKAQMGVKERAHDGQKHAQRGQVHSLPGRFRRAEPLQPQDEQDAGGQVEDLKHQGLVLTVHRSSCLAV